MRFQYSAFVVVFISTTFIWGVMVPRDLPNGFWAARSLGNGTTVTTSLDDLTLAPIVLHEDLRPQVEERTNIQKRDFQCYGYFWDHGSVDSSNQGIQNTVSNGGRNIYWLASQDKENGVYVWIGQTLNGVLVYFCIDTPNTGYDVQASTIRDGMAAMDSVCQPYEAGWALIYPNLPFRILRGKYATGTPICQ
jgi:hypothetical protein